MTIQDLQSTVTSDLATQDLSPDPTPSAPTGQVEAVARGPQTHLSRGQILQATAACLHEEGYDATTIRRIAGRLGCAVGSIYRYFTDKRELLYAVTQGMLEPVAALAEAAAPNSAPVSGAFETSLRMYQQRVAAGMQCYRLMFWLASVQPDACEHTVPSVVQRIIDGWARALGSVNLARDCWTTLHGSLLLGQTGPAAIDQMLHVACRALPTAALQIEPQVHVTPAARLETIRPARVEPSSQPSHARPILANAPTHARHADDTPDPEGEDVCMW